MSTLNGPIAAGDQIAVSPYGGVGEKAAPGSRVIGLAQAPFGANAQGSRQQSVTDLGGKEHTISVGVTRLSIGIGNGSLAAGTATNGLQRFAESQIGHSISMVRVVMSLFVAIVGVAVVMTLMYTAIYGAVISIGRNPLAKVSVFKTLYSVLAMALGLAAIATVTVVLLFAIGVVKNSTILSDSIC